MIEEFLYIGLIMVVIPFFAFFTKAYLIFLFTGIVSISYFYCRKILVWVPFVLCLLIFIVKAIGMDLLSILWDFYNVTMILFPIIGIIISIVQDNKPNYSYLKYYPLYILLWVIMYFSGLYWLMDPGV